MSQIDLIATIEVGSDELPPAAALLQEYSDVVHAEPGNLRFETYVDRAGGAIVVVERYASSDAFEAHLASPENATFNARLTEILRGGGSTLLLLDPLG
jgi:quinol monooxygenase YgiN